MKKKIFNFIIFFLALILLLGGFYFFKKINGVSRQKNNLISSLSKNNDHLYNYDVNNEQKYEILANIQNWSSYSPITNKNDKWVGSSDCGNPEFELLKKQVANGEVKQYLFNGLELIITPNYFKWSNEKFLAFNHDQTAICAAGGRYPLHAFSDKLLWESVCTTGMVGQEITEENNKTIECLKVKNVIDDYFDI